MSGILGSYDLKGGVIQSICQCDVDGVTTANVSICNRHNVDVRITLALTSSENAFSDARYIEFETVLKPKGVLERSAIALAPGTYITVEADNSHVSAVAYGIRAGDEVSVTPITTNTDPDAPILAVTSFNFNEFDKDYEYQLETTNETGAVTYYTTDTMPTGFNLTTDGRIIGSLVDGSSSPTTVDVIATDSSGNSSTTAVDLNIPDGSSSALAAPSAAFIKRLTDTDTDGTYWIDLETSGATETYCVMDSRASGGGWMLAMKATRGNTFNNSSSYWENTTLLNETDVTVNDADAKYAVFNEYKGTDIGARFPDVTAGGTWGNQLGGWTMSDNDAFEDRTLLNVFQGGQITIRTQSDVDNWSGLGKNNSGPFSTQSGFRWQGINYTGNSSNLVRYGFAWNNENDEGSNDVSGGIGMNRIDASAGDYIGCCQDYNGVQRTMRMELYVR